jgi:hypothetical protein
MQGLEAVSCLLPVSGFVLEAVSFAETGFSIPPMACRVDTNNQDNNDYPPF